MSVCHVLTLIGVLMSAIEIRLKSDFFNAFMSINVKWVSSFVRELLYSGPAHASKAAPLKTLTEQRIALTQWGVDLQCTLFYNAPTPLLYTMTFWLILITGLLSMR